MPTMRQSCRKHKKNLCSGRIQYFHTPGLCFFSKKRFRLRPGLLKKIRLPILFQRLGIFPYTQGKQYLRMLCLLQQFHVATTREGPDLILAFFKNIPQEGLHRFLAKTQFDNTFNRHGNTRMGRIVSGLILNDLSYLLASCPQAASMSFPRLRRTVTTTSLDAR